MKYSKKFEQDYEWYLSILGIFAFDGANEYLDRKGNSIIIESKTGVSAKEAFYFWDSRGEIKPTKEPELLKKILKTKGSVNLHIKMYAEDRAKGILPKCDFDEIVKELRAPDWFAVAVESQKYKYYEKVA